MKLTRTEKTAASGISLIEMLVYMSVLLVIMGVGYAALYNCMDYSTTLCRSSDDIVNALHAGENWRADIRAASGRIQLETSQEDQIIRLPGTRGEVSYRFANNTIFRRLGNNEWSQVLARVKTSTFVSDSRRDVAAWRWELELQARTNKFTRILPLFTFVAVPTGELPK
jgi:Tfp pilus assembly protein FimT